MKKIINYFYNIKSDKLLHLIAGIIIYQLSYNILIHFVNVSISLGISIIIVILAGGIKELIDIKIGVPSIKDFLFTCIGGIIELLITLI